MNVKKKIEKAHESNEYCFRTESRSINNGYGEIIITIKRSIRIIFIPLEYKWTTYIQCTREKERKIIILVRKKRDDILFYTTLLTLRFLKIDIHIRLRRRTNNSNNNNNNNNIL